MMATNRFQADYAKRVAGCKKCKESLPKGEVRLAKISPNPFVQNPDGGPPPDMKQYFHPKCLFETFLKARATTKVIEEPGDIEGYGDLEQADKDAILALIEELEKSRSGKTPKTPKKTPAKKNEKPSTSELSSQKKRKEEETPKKGRTEDKETKEAEKNEEKKGEKVKQDKPNEDSKYNSFYRFCKLCDVIASVGKHTEKAEAVKLYLAKDDFDGDVLTILRFLIPSTDHRVYNMKEKQMIKHFSNMFDLNSEELLDKYQQSGDLSETIRETMEEAELQKTKKSDWSIQKIDRWLDKLAKLSGDDEQQAHLHFAVKRLSSLEVQYLLRLIKRDMRFNAGTKVILDGLGPTANEVFQNCRDLAELVQQWKSNGKVLNVMDIGIRLGTPVRPMLAEPCKGVQAAVDRKAQDLYVEIKYDGERVQIHKQGDNFSFYSRSLKPVQKHKIADLEEPIRKAFPSGKNMILDAEVLVVDNVSGKPLPFGTLGAKKKENLNDASTCLFVFDCLMYNDDNLMDRPLEERRRILESNISIVKNRVHLSFYTLVKKGDHEHLKCIMWKAMDEGLEGIVIKDVKSVYEPGKRHWMKMKKDYLEEGGMADSADLIVLGAFFGTGNKGGMMSVFLMGVRGSNGKYLTVTKCGNGHSDEQLAKINKQLKSKMKQINKDHDQLPSWLHCNRGLVPDFVIVDPSDAPVWEITGAEFSKSDRHTAGGISIRFPRVTKIRDDKDADNATSLDELRAMFNASKEKSDLDRSLEDETPLYAPKLIKEGESSKKRSKTDDEEEEADEEPEKKKAKQEGHPENQEEKGKDLPLCKYGAQCYQKNPRHLKSFAHPSK